jgi:hypothetical protein
MHLTRVAALLTTLLLIQPTVAPARSTVAQATLDQYFSVDWQVVHGPRGLRIEGYVYNLGRAADRMRLSIEQLDPAGSVIGETTPWVPGVLAGHGRAWFSTPVPEASGYRVQILSFDWITCGM